jgi:hypothetical protein
MIVLDKKPGYSNAWFTMGSAFAFNELRDEIVLAARNLI